MRRYSSAIKRDEELIPATTWTKLENTTPSARGQTQKVTHNLYDPIYVTVVGQGLRRDRTGSEG